MRPLEYPSSDKVPSPADDLRSIISRFGKY